MLLLLRWWAWIHGGDLVGFSRAHSTTGGSDRTLKTTARELKQEV
jgi:hypothetical protein